MKCINCKFRADYEDAPIGITIGKCNRIKMFWDSTEWVRSDDGHTCREIKQVVDDLAFVQDGSDYRAELLVKDDFGCVHFEEIKV